MEKASTLTRLMLVAVTVILAGLVAGCSKGESHSDYDRETPGEVTIAIKDAPSDDIDVFEVDVIQIELTKLNGATVTTLPAAQRINFADLTEMSEVLVGTSIPAGVYTGAVMTLDFDNALVLVGGCILTAPMGLLIPILYPLEMR